MASNDDIRITVTNDLATPMDSANALLLMQQQPRVDTSVPSTSVQGEEGGNPIHLDPAIFTSFMPFFQNNQELIKNNMETINKMKGEQSVLVGSMNKMIETMSRLEQSVSARPQNQPGHSTSTLVRPPHTCSGPY